MTNTRLNGRDNQRENETPHGHEMNVCVCVYTRLIECLRPAPAAGEGKVAVTSRTSCTTKGHDLSWRRGTFHRVTRRCRGQRAACSLHLLCGWVVGCKRWPCDPPMTCPGGEPTLAQRRRESRIKDNKKWDQKKFQRHVVRLSLKWNYLMGGEYQSFRADLFCMKRRQGRSVLLAAASSGWIAAARFYGNRMEGKMKLLFFHSAALLCFSPLLSVWKAQQSI